MEENIKQEQQTPEIDWKHHTASLLGELRNLNYIKEQHIVIQLLKKTGAENKLVLNVMKKDKILYTRTIEGEDSDEMRYQLCYFFYMDVLNQGVMMMDKLQIELEKFDKEKSIIEKVQEGKIVGLDGKKIK